MNLTIKIWIQTDLLRENSAIAVAFAFRHHD